MHAVFGLRLIIMIMLPFHGCSPAMLMGNSWCTWCYVIADHDHLLGWFFPQAWSSSHAQAHHLSLEERMLCTFDYPLLRQLSLLLWPGVPGIFAFPESVSSIWTSLNLSSLAADWKFSQGSTLGQTLGSPSLLPFLEINNLEIIVSYIIAALFQAGVKIPSLLFHPGRSTCLFIDRLIHSQLM